MSTVAVYLLCINLVLVLVSTTEEDLQKLLKRMESNERKMAKLEAEVSDLRLWKSNFETTMKGQIRQERLLLQQTGRESGVAFSAYLSASFGAASFGIRREMVYDKIECNVGNGYDNNTGTFRAPIKGTYSFTWTTCTSGTDKGEIGVELLINNQVHGSIWADSETIGDEECSTGVIVHTLNSGDVVLPDHIPRVV